MLSYISIEALQHAQATYDIAIPQPLFDDILKLTGQNPLGQIVTHYNAGDAFGALLPVSATGSHILTEYFAKCASKHHENRSPNHAYTVTWTIDVDAPSPREAAMEAQAVQRGQTDGSCPAGVFEVEISANEIETIDLAT